VAPTRWRSDSHVFAVYKSTTKLEGNEVVTAYRKADTGEVISISPNVMR